MLLQLLVFQTDPFLIWDHFYSLNYFLIKGTQFHNYRRNKTMIRKCLVAPEAGFILRSSSFRDKVSALGSCEAFSCKPALSVRAEPACGHRGSSFLTVWKQTKLQLQAKSQSASCQHRCRQRLSADQILNLSSDFCSLHVFPHLSPNRASPPRKRWASAVKESNNKTQPPATSGIFRSHHNKQASTHTHRCGERAGSNPPDLCSPSRLSVFWETRIWMRDPGTSLIKQPTCWKGSAALDEADLEPLQRHTPFKIKGLVRSIKK